MRPLVAEIGPEPAGPGLAGPGASTGTGVSSACSTAPARTCRASASSSGRSSAADWPTQSASVERSQVDARRGRRSRSGDTAAGGRRTWRPAHGRAAPAVARPRRSAASGVGACVIASQAAAGEARTNMADAPELPRHVVQHLGDVLAEPAQRAAAGRAGQRIGAVLHRPRAADGPAADGARASAVRVLRRARVGRGVAGCAEVGASASSPPASARAGRPRRASRSDDRPNCMRRSRASCSRSLSISSAGRRARQPAPARWRAARRRHRAGMARSSTTTASIARQPSCRAE